MKSQFWSNRAQVNVATFYNDYKDLQVNFLQGISFTTDNAADATIKGVELEAVVLPFDQFTYGLNLTWLSAQFDDYQFTPTINLDGDTLNRAPEVHRFDVRPIRLLDGQSRHDYRARAVLLAGRRLLSRAEHRSPSEKVRSSRPTRA